jgi:hypothetical protein
MFRNSALVLALALGSLMIVPAQAFAQLTPPAGSAGAGNSAINGIPYGPANPSVVGEPSGIGNASRMPPLGTNAPAPPTSYGALSSSPSPRRVVRRPMSAPRSRSSARIGRAKKEGTGPPARSRTSQHVHGDLPGVLERV